MAMEHAERCVIFKEHLLGSVRPIQIAFLFAASPGICICALRSVNLASLLVSDLPDEDEYDDDYIPARFVPPSPERRGRLRIHTIALQEIYFSNVDFHMRCRFAAKTRRARRSVWSIATTRFRGERAHTTRCTRSAWMHWKVNKNIF